MGLLEDLTERQKKLEDELAALRKQYEGDKLKADERPVRWLSKADARQYFIINNKPVSHSSMGEWVNKWLQEGVLKIGENCLVAASGRIMISEKFLVDRSKQKQ